MLPRLLLQAGLATLVAGTFGLPSARADIYTWVDGSGRFNVSNLEPPEGAVAKNVTHVSAPKTTIRDDVAREVARQAEVLALADRVRQLQDEVEFAQRHVSAQADYRAAPAPPVIQFIVNMAPQAAPEPIYASAPSAGCDPSWLSCSPWWGTGFYPSGVVIVGNPGFRQRRPPVRDPRPFSLPPLVLGSGPPRMH